LGLELPLRVQDPTVSMNKDEHVKISDTILNSQSETLQEHFRGKRAD